MPAPPKDWTSLTAKLERAEEHIFNLREFWDGFRDDAFPILFKDTPDRAYRMYYLGNVTPVPADVPLIAGDAIHDLRSALDHLTYRLVCVGTNSSGPFERFYFPIGERAREFKAGIRKIRKYLTPDAEEALGEINAYRGGTGQALWHIHKLDIIDKHHLLLTLAAQNRFHSMSPVEIARIRHQFLGVLRDVPEANDPFMFLKSGATHFPLETGTILDVLPMADVHENMQFPIEVAFGEPELVKGKPVIETLQQAASLIRNIFMQFDSADLFG